MKLQEILSILIVTDSVIRAIGKERFPKLTAKIKQYTYEISFLLKREYNKDINQCSPDLELGEKAEVKTEEFKKWIAEKSGLPNLVNDFD